MIHDRGPAGKAIAGVVLVAAWVATWRPATDPDLWWHLALGNLIRLDGAVPATDPFSWWTAGERLVAHSWLWDLLVSVGHAAAGPVGVSVLGAAVSGVIVILMDRVLAISTEGAIAPIPRALVVLAAIATILPLTYPRAQLLDLAAVLGLALAWSLYLRRGQVVALVAVPLITLAWANLHGSAIWAYVACLVALAVAVPVGERWGTWPRRARVPLLASAVAGVLAIAINPYGVGLFLYPFDPTVASAGAQVLDEWRSPDFTAPGFWPLRIVVAGALIAALAFRDRLRDPLLLLLAAGWLFATLGSVRFALLGGPLVVLAVGPAVAAVLFRQAVTSRPAADALVRGEPSDAPVRAAPVRAAPIRALAAVAAIAIVAVGTVAINPTTQDTILRSRLPIAAVDQLVGEGCEGRLLNAYDWGGYVAWASDIPVGAYGNSPLGVVETQADLEALRVDPVAFLDGEGVSVVLLKAGTPLEIHLRTLPGWVVTNEDPVAVTIARDGAGC